MSEVGATPAIKLGGTSRLPKEADLPVPQRPSREIARLVGRGAEKEASQIEKHSCGDTLAGPEEAASHGTRGPGPYSELWELEVCHAHTQGQAQWQESMDHSLQSTVVAAGPNKGPAPWGTTQRANSSNVNPHHGKREGARPSIPLAPRGEQPTKPYGGEWDWRTRGA